MQDSAAQLRAFMKKHRLTQEALARHVGVSQSTVSRALTNAPIRHGEARSRLFIYASIQEQQSRGEAHGSRRVLKAFKRVWDGSDGHADAVARIIEATADLRPMASKERRR
ncbi:MAG: helix-turn-helix domain-containing protein [Vicinamibacteria bacterium]